MQNVCKLKKNCENIIFSHKKLTFLFSFPQISMFSWSYKMLGGRIKPSRGLHAARGPRVWGAWFRGSAAKPPQLSRAKRICSTSFGGRSIETETSLCDSCSRGRTRGIVSWCWHGSRCRYEVGGLTEELLWV